MCALCLCVERVAAQDSVEELLKKLRGEDETQQKEAADALVARGKAARAAVEKAHRGAGSDRKARFEEVLLRIDAGTDADRAKLGPVTFRIHEASLAQEPAADGKIALRLKVVFEGANGGDAPAEVTILRATLHTLKGKMEMLVKGSKGEPFSRTFDPSAPKMFEYGSVLPPRHPPGTLAVVVFETGAGRDVASIRTPLLVVEKR